MHLIRLTLDSEGLRSSTPVDVTIATDHPDQPQVAMSILVVSAAQEGGE